MAELLEKLFKAFILSGKPQSMQKRVFISRNCSLTLRPAQKNPQAPDSKSKERL